MIGKTNVKVKPNEKMTFVDYIENTGTEYIDTGFKPNQDTRVVCEVSNFPNTIEGWLFGSRNSSSPRDAFGFIAVSTKQYRSDYNNDVTNIDASINFTEKFIIDKNKNVTSLNGTVVHESTYSAFQSQYNMYIFAVNQANTAGLVEGSTKRIHSFKIYDNDVLIRDFKPCKDKTGVYCLYDAITKKCFYNQGTGQFIGEGWKPTELEYVKANGTEVINTNVKPTTKTTYEISVEIDVPTVKTDTCLFGSRPGSGSNQYILWDGYNTDDVSHKTLPVLGTLSYEYQFTPPSTRNVFKYDGTHFYCNGEIIWNITNSTGTSNYPIYLFALNSSNTPDSRRYKGKLFYFKIWEDGELIRDYMPSVDLNGVVCLYDKVNKEFVLNTGSGALIGGAVV